MKKKLVGLLAALMVLTMGTTVFAASSPTADDIANAESAATSVTTDKGVTLSKSEIAVSEYKEAEAKATAMKPDAEVLAAFELTAPAGTTFPLTVTISVSGIQKGDTVRVLHKCSVHGWETLTPSKVSNGSVTVSVDSLSPIAVVRTATAAENAAAGNDSEAQPVINNYYYYTNPAATNGNTAMTTGSTTATNGAVSTTATNSGVNQANNNNQVVNVYAPAPAAAAVNASTSTKSPKTGAAVPVLSLIAVLSVIGIAVCTNKARSL